MARRALGKGLDALLGGAPVGGSERKRDEEKKEYISSNEYKKEERADSSPGAPLSAKRSANEGEDFPAGVREIPLERIVPNTLQPRQHFREEGMRELVNSIREQGILQPVAVRPRRKKEGESGEIVYELIAGERRWRASLEAGLTAIPAVIREADDSAALQLALIENIQRENLGPLEEAEAYQELMRAFQLTHEEIAHKVGKERTTITNALRLLRLPEEAREELAAGRISAGHARAILALSRPEDQIKLLYDILKQGLSVRQAEKWVLAREGVTGSKRGKQGETRDPNIRALEDDLMRMWGAPIHVRKRKRGARIVIEVKSNEEFERLIKLFRRASATPRSESSENGPLGPSSLGMR